VKKLVENILTFFLPSRGTEKSILNISDLSSCQLLQYSDAELHGIGSGQLALGNYTEAVRCLGLLHKRNPRDGVYRAKYCRALMLINNIQEAQVVAQGGDLPLADPGRPTPFHDLDILERQIIWELRLDACQTVEALAQLSRATRYVIESDVLGDFVECGVFRGASIICIIRTLQALGVSDRDIWLFDTFEGMPRPENVDQYYLRTEDFDGGIRTWNSLRRTDGSGGSNWAYCPIEEVRAFVLATGYPKNRIHFVKGMVEDTIPSACPDNIGLLRLDTDFFASTRHELTHLYPRLSRRGVLLIDDYGAYQGARKATDEYFNAHPPKPLLARIDENVRLAIKP
jgi:hypothetical protein